MIIAILAAISVVAYNGIQQCAKTAAINASVDRWSKALQQNAVIGGSLAASSDARCLGNSATDFPAGDGFPAGVCATVTVSGTVINVEYQDSFFSSWNIEVRRANGLLPVTNHTATIDGSPYSYRARGVWVYGGSMSPSGVTLAWLPQVSGQCVKGRIESVSSQSTDGGLCSYALAY